jgi:hypothetical protein
MKIDLIIELTHSPGRRGGGAWQGRVRDTVTGVYGPPLIRGRTFHTIEGAKAWITATLWRQLGTLPKIEWLVGEPGTDR